MTLLIFLLVLICSVVLAHIIEKKGGPFWVYMSLNFVTGVSVVILALVFVTAFILKTNL